MDCTVISVSGEVLMPGVSMHYSSLRENNFPKRFTLCSAGQMSADPDPKGQVSADPDPKLVERDCRLPASRLPDSRLPASGLPDSRLPVQ